MFFYNGANLLIDIILVSLVWLIAHSWGYKRGVEENEPPF